MPKKVNKVSKAKAATEKEVVEVPKQEDNAWKVNDDDDDEGDEGDSDDDDDDDVELPPDKGIEYQSSLQWARPGDKKKNTTKKNTKDDKNKDKKRKRKADGDDDGDDDEQGENKEEEQETITVEFGFWDPRPIDFHTIKLLLKDYIECPTDEDFKLSEFSDLISNQVTVGTMIKADGTQDQPIGFISALNMHTHCKLDSFKQIREFLLRKCSDQSKKRTLQGLFTDTSKQLGLLVQARLVNAPIQLIPQLHSSLQEDIAWAVKNEDTADLKRSFEFDNYLLISRCYVMPSEEDDPQPPTKKKKGKQDTADIPPKKKTKTLTDNFQYFEEEYFKDEASTWFTFDARQRKDFSESQSVPQKYYISVVPRKAIAKVLKRVHSLGLDLGGGALSVSSA